MCDINIEFSTALRSYGFNPGEIVADGRFHRFDIDKKGDKAGWYILSCEPPCGTYGNWRTGEKTTWKPDNYDSASELEKNVYRKKIAEQKKQVADKRKQENKKAAEEAQKCLNAAKPASINHPYLKNKKVTIPNSMKGLRQSGDSLLLPVLDRNGKVQSLQTINPDGSKRFHPGGKITGGYFPLKSEDRDSIYICEGLATSLSVHEATGSTVLCAFNAGNLHTVAKIAKDLRPGIELIIAGDNDHQTEGNPGKKKAEEAARSVGGKVIIPEMQDGVTDFNDLHSLYGISAVTERLAQSENLGSIDVKPLIMQNKIRELAEMPSLEYEQIRESMAEQMRVRVTVLDKEVYKARSKVDPSRGFFDIIEPWEEPVDGRELVLELNVTFERFSVLPKGSAMAASLWTILTYCYDQWSTLPLLGVLSPEKRCGKSTFMTTLDCLCFNALSASNISPAAVFRVIEAHKPCLLIDEGDTFLKENDELRGVINSGHTRAQAYVVRCDGDNNEPVKFTTWAPKAIAMIGRLPDTIEDRAVIVPLKRKLTTEYCDRHTQETRHELSILRRRIARFVEDNLEELRKAKPGRLSTGNDRQADNWEPLFAIAKVARVEKEAQVATLSFLTSYEDEQPIAIQLLQDIQEVFVEKGMDKIFSANLVRRLVEMEDRPWCEWKKGQPMTANSLSRILKGYEIRPKLIRIGHETKRGYEKAAFDDPLSRYAPAQSVTALQINNSKHCSDSRSVTGEQGVTCSNPGDSSNNKGCNTVTAQIPSRTEKRGRKKHMVGRNQLLLFDYKRRGVREI